MHLHDLRDTGRLLALQAQAVQAQWLGASEAERLAFVALAQHVLTYRPENAGGLFTHLVRTRCFAYITQADEDAARQRLNRYLYRDPFPAPVPDAARVELAS